MTALPGRSARYASDARKAPTSQAASVFAPVASSPEKACAASVVPKNDARAQADKIIEAAKKEAQDILLNAREAMADEAAALSVDIAGKILSREIKLSEHKQMISEFLEKVG